MAVLSCRGVLVFKVVKIVLTMASHLQWNQWASLEVGKGPAKDK